jgi:hypothetical protein
MKMQPTTRYDKDKYPDLKAHYESHGKPLGVIAIAAMLAALAALMQGCGAPS